jgi:leucyl aminopeptidase
VGVSYVFEEQGRENGRAIPLVPLQPVGLGGWKEAASPRQRRWLEAAGFEARPGQCLPLPDADGDIEFCLFGMQEQGWLYQLASVYGSLPPATYALRCDWSAAQQVQACLGWGLAAYRFERYHRQDKPAPRLRLDEPWAGEVQSLCRAQTLVRDLVNTPTEHLGPAELADAVVAEADRFDADCRIVSGADLLTDNFPAIHAVGRASSRPPLLAEMDWGDEDAPLLVLVGKGVCFDSGGLDLKNASGMALMKKDMGGAAHALALARLVMERGLGLRLKLLIPAVENSVAGNAYRPGDIITTRKGLTVEIGNTDAEGRVILSDAMAYGCEQQPDLVIDFATLTGAARIALGTDLPALFSNDAGLARSIQAAGDECEDPLWTLPLYQPYQELIKSPIADLTNASKSTYGGCITAALFLEHFVRPDIQWAHIDTFAWNASSRPGRPEGGEALGLRAVFHYLQSRYG